MNYCTDLNRDEMRHLSDIPTSRDLRSTLLCLCAMSDPLSQTAAIYLASIPPADQPFRVLPPLAGSEAGLPDSTSTGMDAPLIASLKETRCLDLLLPKQLQRDDLAHRFRAGIVRMQVVAAVVKWQESCRVTGIA